MGHRILFAASLVAVVFATAACGGGGSDAYGESSPVRLDGDSVTVEMGSGSFEPQGIKVKRGTTVTWINNDPVVHNVRQVESTFLSPDVAPGESFSFTMDEPGRYRYQCTYHHPNMNGVVIVE